MRRRRAIWSSSARSDLQQIHNHISLDNPQAADDFILDVYRKVRSLADLGIGGTNHEEFGIGIRSLAYRQRIIFFTMDDDCLFVVRILHGRRDISPDDFSESND
ncbi:type II toxin-antitoxin system RelE/ParE family toxin [Rhizobium sp. 18055]|uniref:type II toxin-antitoxin system RelE/ParE family toxin n=1 Tax=Rhizobium sp. 18055 TaxID=2681403 RepID=UPI00135BAB8C